MIELSIGSVLFALLIVIVPLVLRSVLPSQRRYAFLIINIAVYALVIKDIGSAAVTVLWILVPFFIAPFIADRPVCRKIFYILLIGIYVLLMGYGHVSLFKIIGLSYFLFREIDFTMQYSYIISDESAAEVHLTDYLNYVLSFYTLLAGPIERYEDFYINFNDEGTPGQSADIIVLMKRILDGYFKVYVISAVLKWSADICFQKISETDTVPKALLLFFVFATLNGWYIYFNFSGYCDVVIAAAALAGLKVHENFNRPYLARSVVEFWNRHHITLSEWIRDYIYSPVMKFLISGIFRNKLFAGQCVALFVTFLIAGIWHGTNMNYVLYGLFQGLGIVMSTLYTTGLKKILGKAGFKKYESGIFVRAAENSATWIYICLTFSFVGYDIIGMVKGLAI